MRTLRYLTAVAIMSTAIPGARGQDLSAMNQQWHRALSSVQRGDASQANADFATFNRMARSYVISNGRNWQIEYLLGSLDCVFPGTQTVGAEYLQDILQNNRTLNNQGNAELQRQLSSCQSGVRALPTTAGLTLPQDLTEASTHYQLPGIRGDMKGGAATADSESSAVVSPVAAAELLARRVKVDDPQKALENALARLPNQATGAIVGEFAVTTLTGTTTEATAIGKCLEAYATPLSAEFQIDSPAFMVTVYAVPDELQVYDFARRLHGLNLPIGVIAYSVPEDMSLASPGSGTDCGSMAHELVHLLIKRGFSGAPAWLEEGLASETAIASPTKAALKFGWSWRDDSLQKDSGLRPRVAELLNLPWSSFNPESTSEVRSSEAIQAMAAVFIRYLDAKGKLPEIYFGVRDQHLSADLSGFKGYDSILEEKLNMTVASIDADFGQWFAAESRGHRIAGPPRGSGGVPGQYINASHIPGNPCATPNQQSQQTAQCDPTSVPPSANGPAKPQKPR